MSYKEYPMSYLIDIENSNKLVVEDSSRKRLRRRCRRQYAEQYSIQKTYIIVSGEDYKNAIHLYKKQMTEQTEKTQLSHKSSATSKKTIVKKTNKKINKPSSMLEEAIQEESRQNEKLNKKNNRK